jgi:hypothetical protein
VLWPSDRWLFQDASGLAAFCALQREVALVIAGAEHVTVAEKTRRQQLQELHFNPFGWRRRANQIVSAPFTRQLDRSRLQCLSNLAARKSTLAETKVRILGRQRATALL